MDWGIFDSSRYSIAQWLFLRGMGLCYFLAFASLLVQIRGLWGSLGIEPIHLVLRRYRRYLGKRDFFKVPTVFWWQSSDVALYVVGFLGLLASAAVVANYAVVPALVMSYLAYLSYCSVGSRFLSFQWDSLLLELGFASIFFAWQQPASPVLLLLMWFILFRFMFSSGLVKLLSKDRSWWTCTALYYHFETQPLPTSLAWHAHQLPKHILRLGCGVMFFIELLVPFGIFTTPTLQFLVFLCFTLLMIGIAATGNYCFFNLLTVVTSLLLVENRFFLPFFGEGWVGVSSAASMGELGFLLLAALLLGTLNVLFLIDLLLPGLLPVHFRHVVAPFFICNHYGLFAVMTTERREIIVEGSEDRELWKEYEFKWKPGRLSGCPRFVAPHQPRLDWQLWFAALGAKEQNQWLLRYFALLLRGNKASEHLLKCNPFPDKPPRYIRSRLFRYRFTDPETRARTGEWWQRELLGSYSAPMKLKESTSTDQSVRVHGGD